MFTKELFGIRGRMKFELFQLGTAESSAQLITAPPLKNKPFGLIVPFMIV
jgi:hypothetical protein